MNRTELLVLVAVVGVATYFLLTSSAAPASAMAPASISMPQLTAPSLPVATAAVAPVAPHAFASVGNALGLGNFVSASTAAFRNPMVKPA